MVVNRSRSGCMDDLSIALVIFEGAEEHDVVGPYEMFWWMSLFLDLPPDRPIGESGFADTFYPKVGSPPKVFTVAPTTDTYRMSSGMRFIPDFSYDNAPAANMIFAPGGRGARDIPALQKNGTIDYIIKVASAPGRKYVMSVCTGAFCATQNEAFMGGVSCAKKDETQ
jgi:putative intracellular protease/amidase